MKVRYLTVALCFVALSVSLFPYAVTVSASKSPSPTWTFMVYLDCDNNLDPFGPINLQQMSSGLSTGANVSVVVLMDRLNLPAYTYNVTHGGIKTVQSLSEVDMGSPGTLTSFVNFTLEHYPSTYYFLDIWDHGQGYVGTCWDASSSHHLSPHDVETAIARAESATGKRVDVVGFDACLMGMVEVCYELKDVTDIVVGSEMLVPGYGWPYAQLMTYLSNNPAVNPTTLSTELVNEYVAYYPKSAVQLSAINEASFADFVTNLDDFADALRANVFTYQGVIAGARSSSQQTHILGTDGAFYYVDIYKFATIVGAKGQNSTIQQLSVDLRNKLDAAVFAEAHNTKQGHLDMKEFGLTIYFPPNKKAYNVNYETYVPSFTQGTTWLSFLKAYYNAL